MDYPRLNNPASSLPSMLTTSHWRNLYRKFEVVTHELESDEIVFLVLITEKSATVYVPALFASEL